MTNGRDPARRRDPAEITRLAIERRMSRRTFLAGTGAGIGALALAACAPSSGASNAPSAAPSSGGATGNLGDTLNLATWPNYHSQEVLDAFTSLTGVAINVGVYGSTEEMEAKIRAGNSGIDVVVPSNYAIEGWVADGLIEELDYGKLPSFVKADWNARFMDQAFDKGNTVSIPKNWGTTGIAYRSSKVTEPVTTWKQFFDAAGTTYDGKAMIVDHQISSFGSAAVAMGYSLNTIDPTEMAAVEAMLTALKPKLFAISSDVQPPLRALDTWLSIAWTGDGVQVGRDNEDARYVVAEDGGELWIDSYTVAADAPHRDAAYAFIDYITQPEQAAAETEYCLFPHANDKATALLIDEVKNNPVIYPSADSLVALEYAVNATYNSPERAEAWARIKASA
ncbi:MAG: spermidine/putrescine ABC transporter substrate-binding protein [Chloroflexota bacterium]|nr:spermidine/putrescine ABC transporter substrate-binding protein [Chloroflexota bacterium]